MAEEDERLRGNYLRNAPWSQPGASYFTTLPTDQELAFRRWVGANGVKFNPDASIADYDMRGFWQALQRRDPRAVTAIDPNDQKLHYPDYWKTPYHETFSNQSQWATRNAPHWTEDDKLVTPDGRVIFDDKARR